MTELMEYQNNGIARLETTQDVAVQRLTEWAQSAQAAHQVATSLVNTSFVPQQFRGKPDEATAAILAGLEVGLSPMSALRAFDIIQGQAAPRAITLRAVVQSYGHEMVLLESTTTRCRMKGRRKGSSEWQPVTWTLDRAKDLNLLGKDNWKKQPAAMLVARATSELARLIASDAILGIGYSSEEVEDGGLVSETPQEPVSAPQNGTRRMSRRQAQPPAEEPPAPTESPLLDPASDLAKAMFASMNEAGITDRDDRLKYVSDVIGREVASSNEMTEDDARAVLDALKKDAEPIDGELVDA